MHNCIDYDRVNVKCVGHVRCLGLQQVQQVQYIVHFVDKTKFRILFAFIDCTKCRKPCTGLV